MGIFFRTYLINYVLLAFDRSLLLHITSICLILSIIGSQHFFDKQLTPRGMSKYLMDMSFTLHPRKLVVSWTHHQLFFQLTNEDLSKLTCKPVIKLKILRAFCSLEAFQYYWVEKLMCHLQIIDDVIQLYPYPLGLH